MKVIILAGGFGTRLYEYTRRVPKPMVKIAGLPILIHILRHYLKYGFKNFIIAAGYKNKIIKDYFKKFKKDGEPFVFKINNKKCNITIADTGQKTLTGGRLKRLKKYFKNNETFMFTYGDGLCDVNLKKLLKFHQKNKKLITVTAVRPPARFGEIRINILLFLNKINYMKTKKNFSTKIILKNFKIGLKQISKKNCLGI